MAWVEFERADQKNHHGVDLPRDGWVSGDTCARARRVGVGGWLWVVGAGFCWTESIEGWLIRKFSSCLEGSASTLQVRCRIMPHGRTPRAVQYAIFGLAYSLMAWLLAVLMTGAGHGWM